MNNNQSENIIIKNVKLLYPVVFKPEAPKGKWGEGKPPRYEATIILHKEKDMQQIELISQIIDKLKQQEAQKRGKYLNISPTHLCLKDGDLPNTEGTIYPELQNHYFIRCRAQENSKIAVINQDKEPIKPEDDLIYSGCFVDIKVYFFLYSKKQIGIGCTFEALKFVKHGEKIVSSGEKTWEKLIEGF